MEIKLSDRFTYPKLLRFTIPTMLMILCTSSYGIVDGVFISNFAGVTDFSAVNLMFPFIYGAATLGYMFGSGGNAVIAKLLGEKDDCGANRAFSMIVLSGLFLGVITAAVMYVLTPSFARSVGAAGALYESAVKYAKICFLFTPPFILQTMFLSFFIAAGKPKLSLYVNIVSGVINIFFDWLFIAEFNLGVEGAASATGLGQLSGAVIPLIYFIRKNSSLLKLTAKFKFNGKILGLTCANGSSEMVTNLSMSIVNTLYNAALIETAGEPGPAAYGVVLYLNFLFAAIFLGYSQGSAPIVSYDYGARNVSELQNITKKSLTLMLSLGVFCTAFAYFVSPPFARVFCAGNPELYELAVHGSQIFAFSYLLSGFNIWASAFFTALSNGLISALLSFLRLFVFQIGCILILPRIFGLSGIWASIAVAEVLAAVPAAVCLFACRNKYGYFKKRCA